MLTVRQDASESQEDHDSTNCEFHLPRASWMYTHPQSADVAICNDVCAAELDLQILAKSAESADLVVRAKGAPNRRPHYCKYWLSVYGKQV